MLAILKLVSSLVAGPLFDYLKTAKQAELSRETLAAEIERALIANQTQIAGLQRDVIMAEIGGEDWLQRNWRPIVAMTSFFSYWFVIFLYPFLLKAGLVPQVSFGEVGLQNFFYLTTVCVGGYIGGRTIEKVMRRT